MAIINCPECKNEVSDAAPQCPTCGVRIRKVKRGFFGWLFKWLFILFNLLMAVFLFFYFDSLSDITTHAKSNAEQAGTAIGGTIGAGLLLSFWVCGDIILGAMVFFTRQKS